MQSGDKRIACILFEKIYVQAGISAQNIDALLITQPITYATGGMVEHLLPHAKVYISEAGVLEQFRNNRRSSPWLSRSEDGHIKGANWHFATAFLQENIEKHLPIGLAENLYYAANQSSVISTNVTSSAPGYQSSGSLPMSLLGTD